jgi:serine/threonine protein kinase
MWKVVDHAGVMSCSPQPTYCAQVAWLILPALPCRYQAEREIRLHGALSHPHILPLYIAFEDPDAIYLVLESAASGDLFAGGLGW